MVGVEEMMRASELQSHYATAQLDAEIAAVKAQFEDELARVRAENDRLVVIAREEQRSRAAASLAAEQAHADELARLRAQVEAEHGRLVAEQQVRRAEAQAREAELKALRETLRAEREEAEAKIDQLTNAISAAPSPSSIAAPWSVALRNLGWQASLAAAVSARLKAAMASPARLDGAKLAEIERNVQALSTSIQNLSRFAHTLASASECKQAPVDLSVLVAQIAAQAKGIAANANVGLETRVTGTDRVMVADEARLRCAWVCLVVNAIRFTPAGGTVSLEVHSLPDGSLRLEVADTGAGIAPDKLAELNAVLDSGVSATPGRPGDVAGLGIPTAAALARQMGGTFELESQPGHGTRALMVFPKSRQAQSAARQALAG
jgi:signal transduction histidine kinase